MSFRPDPRVPFLLTAALCLAPALAEAQPGFTITPKATTSAQPAITGSPGKVAPNLPKIPA
ncbi:MAG TPA: hypothetical protein VKB65_08360, partial [Myxococcota bacterium]|nr:hypothetical protein [Myxococcota bacterium]